MILFASLLFNSDADEERKAVRPGMVSNQKYKDGMEQRKLSIKDPEQALAEPLWKACAAIFLGGGYSVTMQFRQAPPMAAE